VSDSFPILTLLILVPIVGAAIVACMPKDNEGLLKLVGVTSAGVALALSIALVFDYQADGGGFQFLSEHVWIRDFGISWKLGVDGISLFLVALTGVLFPLAIVGPSVHRDVKGYVAWMLVLEAGCMGVFLSLDLFLFFLFWELVLVPMYFLIGGWGYDRRIYATIKFFLYTMVG
jgi:NADH-quinone oxidoreductase subunit M